MTDESTGAVLPGNLPEGLPHGQPVELPGGFPTGLRRVAEADTWLQWSARVNRATGKIDKQPCGPTGYPKSYTAPDNHRSFAAVWADLRSGPYGRGTEERPVSGLGFYPKKEQGFLFIDIDDCRDPESGVLTDAARGVVEACNTYTEISPSGTGLRIVGSAEGWARWKSKLYRWPDDLLRGEIYEGENGFVTITLNPLPGYADKWGPIGDVCNYIIDESARDASGIRDGSGARAREPNPVPEAPIEEVRAAVEAIPNDGATPAERPGGLYGWDAWKMYMGAPIYRATNGSDEGLQIWIEWSRKHPSYIEGMCEEEWDRFHASPPDRTGFARLRYLARLHDPDWNGSPVWDAAVKGARDREVVAEFGEGLELPRVEGLSSADPGPVGPRGGGLGGGSGAAGMGSIGGDAGDDDGVGFDVGDWRNLLRRGAPRKSGEPGPIKPHLLNVNIALTNAPEWAGVFAYDSFTSRVMVQARPPYDVAEGDDGQEGSGGAGGGAGCAFAARELKEVDLTNTVLWLQTQGIETNIAHVNQVINLIARANTYSSVVRYLDSLEWDGTPRLDRVLIDFLGAEDTMLNRVFGSKTLIAAVARAYRPGCQVKTVLTLEGPQNIGKSKFCATLVPDSDWFTDTCPDFGSKDAAIQLQGIWIQEHSEMATLNKVEANKAKAFISINSDRYRVPHGIVAETFPRQCVFVATINPGGAGYLKDETGASRFWPVECGVGWERGDQLDTDLLVATRDQIWAEAVARFHCGETWWLDNVEIQEEQDRAAETRYAADVWEHAITEYVAKNEPPVTMAKILQQAIGKPAGMCTAADAMRVGAILKRHGWERRRMRENGTRVHKYVPVGWSGTVLKLVSDSNYPEDSGADFAVPPGA